MWCAKRHERAKKAGPNLDKKTFISPAGSRLWIRSTMGSTWRERLFDCLCEVDAPCYWVGGSLLHDAFFRDENWGDQDMDLWINGGDKQAGYAVWALERAGFQYTGRSASQSFPSIVDRFVNLAWDFVCLCFADPDEHHVDLMFADELGVGQPPVSVASFLMTFDLDVCRVWRKTSFGSSVKSFCSRELLKHKEMQTLDGADPENPRYRIRLKKYKRRGFRLKTPGE